MAWHGIPVLRRTVLHVLAQAQRPLGTRAVATTVQCPATTVRRTLQDLQVLKLVRCVKGGTAMPMAGSSVTGRAPLLDLLQRLHWVPRPAPTMRRGGG